MRFIIIGAGGIGGVVGGRLAQSGHDVVLVARGAHGAAIRSDGLQLRSANGVETLRLPVAEHPSDVDFRDGDIAMVAVKSQDTVAVLEALAIVAGAELPVVCLQNGVDNERQALRRFRNVYAVPVICPTAHLSPGEVTVYSSPVSGIFDVGRYPSGTDETCATISAALARSTFASEVCADVMRWKWAKLLSNLVNASEAICGEITDDSRLVPLVRAEGEAVLAAAGISYASAEEEQVRRGDLMRIRPVDGERRGGGSSWQSLVRGVGSIETDHLNGEIVLLGRIHGVPTPVNETLQLLANRAAFARTPPGSMTEDEVIALSDAAPR
jgi:2-dehydropantoate 2-reductase